VVGFGVVVWVVVVVGFGVVVVVVVVVVGAVVVLRVVLFGAVLFGVVLAPVDPCAFFALCSRRRRRNSDKLHFLLL